MTSEPEFDAIVVGAGFAGIYALYRLRGRGLKVRVIEAGAGPGGTWYWNRYPGLRCDAQSMTYSYSFSDEVQQEWTWSERFAGQAEILRYINYVVDRFALRSDMQFETRVTRAAFDEICGRWMIETDRGERFIARFCVMATGCLSIPNLPGIKGLEGFGGALYHTADWPKQGVDFSGKRVGVIGTGSSGVQSIPIIATQAKHLTVFQRTANFSIPARNRPLRPEEVRRWKANYQALREKCRRSPFGDVYDQAEKSVFDVSAEEGRRMLEEAWTKGSFAFITIFKDILTNQAANDVVVAFVNRKIREAIKDPAVAELLCPKDVPIGAKRLCIDTGYYETFNRANVRLVDLKENPIREIRVDGLVAGEESFALDAIVFATGFDAMTGALFAIDLRGRGGVALKDKWVEGPRTYLGLAVAGFPNLFIVAGPGSPSVVTNMVLSIEQHVDWITDCVAFLRRRGLESIEATPESEIAWTRHVGEVAEPTLFVTVKSWYVGANMPGKPQVIYPYLGGAEKYREICEDIVAKGYVGFRLNPAAESRAG
ncbi:MAG: NAD(P)/FAD-dependent oxidoreductase [Alphaproteobacteria bacterium]|nr:NAD(P)/FAD-dependent oxidoreductase [Alphaproteobacteria bacterium]